MKRIVWLLLLALLCGNMNAQGVECVYKVLENGFSGPKGIAGRVYKTGETIQLEEATSFDFQRVRKGVSSIERVTNKYGLFKVDSLFRIAQNERLAKRNNKSLSVSRPSSQRKSADSTLYSFTRKIADIYESSIPSFAEFGTIEVRRDGLKVYVTNTSENDDMFVDIVWIKDGLCMSALSFLRDFVNNSVLYPGETVEYLINEYVASESLFAFCTPYPIEYNTIDLKQANEYDMTYDMNIPLTVVSITE